VDCKWKISNAPNASFTKKTDENVIPLPGINPLIAAIKIHKAIHSGLIEGIFLSMYEDRTIKAMAGRTRWSKLSESEIQLRYHTAKIIVDLHFG
jgi:hypothetical protein